MTEVIRQIEIDLEAPDGTVWWPRVVGVWVGNAWQGYVEFVPLRDGDPIATPRETTQSTREDLEYWASGLEPSYFEGAFARARRKAQGPAAAPATIEPVERDLLGRLDSRAAMLAAAGDLAGAMGMARRVLGVCPHDPDALWILSVAHAERGDRAAARSCVVQFLEYAPVDDPRRSEAGALLAELDRKLAHASGM